MPVFDSQVRCIKTDIMNKYYCPKSPKQDKQHFYKWLSPEEIKQKKIKSQGIGIVECIYCGFIQHSI